MWGYSGKEGHTVSPQHTCKPGPLDSWPAPLTGDRRLLLPAPRQFRGLLSALTPREAPSLACTRTCLPERLLFAGMTASSRCSSLPVLPAVFELHLLRAGVQLLAPLISPQPSPPEETGTPCLWACWGDHRPSPLLPHGLLCWLPGGFEAAQAKVAKEGCSGH